MRRNAKRTEAELPVEVAEIRAAGTLIAVRRVCKNYDRDMSIVVVKAAIGAFMESAEELKECPEVCKIYRAAADELTQLLEEMEKAEQPAEPEAEESEEQPEATQDARARGAYLNTCDECEAIEATGTREAVHEAKKLRTLAAEALAHYLRTHDAEWVEELETLQREAFDYSPDGLQDQRSGAQGIGYHPIE